MYTHMGQLQLHETWKFGDFLHFMNMFPDYDGEQIEL